MWVKWPETYSPETWHASNLRVRVPDPWDELLEAARALAVENTFLTGPWMTRLRAAIAAVEALPQKGAVSE